MNTPRFQRRPENFVCEYCGQQVKGDGYTNHCPTCLWSKHVDINPGDRAEPCGGMMEPVAIEGSSPAYAIVHRCTRCGKERRNKADSRDSRDALIAIAKRWEAGDNSG